MMDELIQLQKDLQLQFEKMSDKIKETGEPIDNVDDWYDWGFMNGQATVLGSIANKLLEMKLNHNPQ